MKYSKNYTIQGKTFRYDYDHAVVEWIYKNEDGKWEVLDGAGLRLENWKNKEARDEYLQEWIMDIEADAEYQMDMFIKYELPLYVTECGGIQKEVE